MSNISKFVAALVLGLMLSLSLMLTSSFAHTANQKQVAAANTQAVTHVAHWSSWGWSSWGGCCDCGCDDWGW